MTDLIIACSAENTAFKSKIFDNQRRFKLARIIRGAKSWLLRVDGANQTDSFSIELDDEMRHKIISFFLEANT